MTGCEALYADMGHFGAPRHPLGLARSRFPALLLNYFGQGALLLSHPSERRFLFYALVPDWAHYPHGGAGDHRHHHRLPGGDLRRLLHHPPGGAAGPVAAHGNPPHLGDRVGQIYVPRINAMLCVGVVLIVLIFKTSDALAAAYGIAVTGVMVISTAPGRAWWPCITGTGGCRR